MQQKPWPVGQWNQGMGRVSMSRPHIYPAYVQFSFRDDVKSGLWVPLRAGGPLQHVVLVGGHEVVHCILDHIPAPSIQHKTKIKRGP
jgi:hypothetical protein